jgi:hypothetical protein
MVEFEHSLFKLLLLVAVLSARPPGRKWLPIIIAGGLLLALLPPPIPIQVPWELLLGLTVPLLLWQNARRIITAQWINRWKDIFIWIVTAALFAMIFWGFKELQLPVALLFGLVAASMVWGAGETEANTSVVSIIGPFTLIFLLAEVEPMIQTPTQYIGGIFSGIFVGILFASGAVYLANRIDSKARNWVALGQIFLAYGFAYMAGVSAVAASLASVITFVTVGIYIGLWPHNRVKPTPLNTWPGFIFILILFLILGWEAHYELSSTILIETAIGFLLGIIIAWLGQRLKLEAFSADIPLWRIGLRVSLLIFATLLIWPHKTLQQPILLAYAFGIAVINLVFAKMTLDYFFHK